MSLIDKEKLLRLGDGESIESICSADASTPETFDAWWTAQTAARVPSTDGTRKADIAGPTKIFRDEWGVPHVFANTDEDLFFGYGYSMAQDRLWQLDYYRRKALGRLAEILGPDSLESDIVVRTVGINRIAANELNRIPAQTMRLLVAFSRGVNAVMEESRDNLPIEFDLLGYRPEPWSPLDSVAIGREFCWYLTGRLPVIAIPELAKRVLGQGPLYEAFIIGEAEDESIIPKGSYPTTEVGIEKVGEVVGDPEDGVGSNNWVVSGAKSTTGLPLVASDPHIAFGSVSCWYEVHLSGGSFNVAGAGYVGIPAIIFGRNEEIAWGITNNICSQRDLYKEKTDPSQPGHFLYDRKWEPARTLTEEIAVKGSRTITKTITHTRNGPIVDELLPEPLRHTGPISLKWLGASFSDELTCLLNLNRAGSCDEVRMALRDWVAPTWSFVFGDREGHIGYQAAGRIPVRNGWKRSYREGWNPKDQWEGFIPYEGMPVLSDPATGFARSANNRGAPEDFPYALSGTWNSGHRARRIRHMLEEKDELSREDFARMQMDVLSMQAVESLPGLIGMLSSASDPRIQRAVGHLRLWDCRLEPDSVAASIFEIFFSTWTQTIAAERFEADAVPLVAGAVAGMAIQLLSADIGWFESKTRNEAVIESMKAALGDLEARLGPDMDEWEWGRIHRMALPHLLSGRGDLGKLMDRGGPPVGGNKITVCNTGSDPNYLAVSGANWRHNADLSEHPPGLWAVDAAGQSGHPGSSHYGDQTPEWLAGRHHHVLLDREHVEARAKHRLILEPVN